MNLSKKERIEKAISQNLVRENGNGIFIQIQGELDPNGIYSTEIYEFETFLPFFYKCPSLPENCISRIKLILKIIKGFSFDKLVARKNSLVVIEESPKQIEFFWTEVAPPSFKWYGFNIYDGCLCVCHEGIRCTEGKRIIYTRFIESQKISKCKQAIIQIGEEIQ